MKYLRKFATASEMDKVERPGVALYADTLSVEYFPKTLPGVYIQHINKKVYTTNEWSTEGFDATEANGVAVVGESHSFVIAKNDASSSAAWGGSGQIVNNAAAATAKDDAVLDLNGIGNTTAIIEQLSEGASAATAAEGYVFPNGQKGYLPSIGEWQMAFEKGAEVKSALALIGGTALAVYNKYHWSSTQADKASAWRIDWYGVSGTAGEIGMFSKTAQYKVRAFTTL
jgi:hypothetical protein